MFDPREKALLQKAFEQYHLALAASLPREEALRAITISPKTERRMARLFYHQKHFYYTLINTAAKRAACILTALFLAATVATVSVEALREGFVRFVVETFERGSFIWFSKEDEGTLTLLPITPKLPAYLPEGYQLVANMNSETELNMIYERGEGETINYQQKQKGSKISVNTEGVSYEKILVADSHHGIIFQNKGSWFLIFNDQEYMYTLIGTVSKEEILKIATSIPFEKK